MKKVRTGRPAFVPPDAVATDLDGTLTLGGEPLKRSLSAVLFRVKKRGAKLVLVTGRCTSEAQKIVGDSLFDAVVAENGAVLVVDGTERRIAPPGWVKIRERLLPQLGRGCEEVIISAGIEKLEVARRLVPRQARIELNKDRLMVIPKGVDKGTGLVSVLAALGLSARRTACVGDGENDISMFEAVGVRIALDNSVEELKRSADLVMEKGDGEGVIEAMGRLFPMDLLGPRRGDSVP